jgi:hypothetical protein
LLNRTGKKPRDKQSDRKLPATGETGLRFGAGCAKSRAEKEKAAPGHPDAAFENEAV